MTIKDKNVYDWDKTLQTYGGMSYMTNYKKGDEK